jgi:hypothetical protein
MHLQARVVDATFSYRALSPPFIEPAADKETPRGGMDGHQTVTTGESAPN